ncbi:tetratricopeptide repeat protein, partial [bacterium]|nr:tetratricopeptide repeat protein [bacterium]
MNLKTWLLPIFFLLIIAMVLTITMQYNYQREVSASTDSIPDTTLARHYYLKADSLLNWSSFDSSIAYFQKAGEFYKKDGNRAAQIDCQTMIAENYRYKGEYRKASELFKQSISDGIQFLGEKSTGVATAYNKLGLVQWALGKNDSALANFEKALALRKELLGENHVDVGWSYNNIGLIQNALGNNDEAIDMYKKALVIIEKNLGSDNDDVARILSNIGIAFKDKGNY